MTAWLEAAGQTRVADDLPLVGGKGRPFGCPGRRLQRRQHAVMAGLAEAGRQELPHAGAAPLSHHLIAGFRQDVGLAAAGEGVVRDRRRSHRKQEKNGAHGRHNSSIGGAR